MLRYINVIMIISILSSCTVNDDDLKNDVKAFDDSYKEIINNLCNTLIIKVGKDTNYVMEYRPRSRDVYFNYRDGSNTGMGYFIPDFKINKGQEDFFMKAKAGGVFYTKKDDMFSIKMFAFKKGNKTVCLYISSKTHTDLEREDRIVYVSQDRVYTLGDAW